MLGLIEPDSIRAFLILGGLKRHVKDFKMLYWVLFKTRKKICVTKYELSNMDEYVMHDVRNYQFPPMMIFAMNVILYVLKRKMGYCDFCSRCLMDVISC